MKASELITLLQDAIDKYGDLKVNGSTIKPEAKEWKLQTLDEDWYEQAPFTQFLLTCSYKPIPD
jgi:hypothetical protein